MRYIEIVAVTGLGGLYQLMSTKSDGAIVRNLADKTTKFVSARVHNVTPLHTIEVYTTGDNVRLHEIFKKMQETEGTITLDDSKKSDNNAVKDYFKKVYPEFDEDRVYVSDMKKMVKWYDILKANDMLKFEDMEANGNSTGGADGTVETVVEEETPKAKKSAKAEDETAEATEKPAKKARAKKTQDTAEDGEEPKTPKKTAARKKKTEE